MLIARDAAKPMQGERVIAIGRITLAALSVVALWLDPLNPAGATRLPLLLLAGYLAYAVVLGVVLARRVEGLAPGTSVAVHLVDMALFALLTFLPSNTASPFFAFFTFAMAAATLRWQLRGVLWTTGLALAILVGMAAWQATLHAELFELNRSIVRFTYLVVMAAILGQLSAIERRSHREIAALARWTRRDSTELSRLLEDNLRQAAAVLGLQRAILVWEDDDEPWTEIAEWDGKALKRWHVPPTEDTAKAAGALPDGDLHLSDARQPRTSVTIAVRGSRSRVRENPLDPGFAEQFDLGSVLVMRVTSELTAGRLYLTGGRPTSAEDLDMATIAAQRVGDALDAHLHGHRLRQVALLEERQRLSDELHDGVVQSIAGVAMLLRRAELSADNDVEAVQSTLREAQQILTEEQRDIRFFVRGLRRPAAEVAELDLEERLSELVRRIEAVWGVRVDARVDLGGEALSLTQEHELFRIAQESVINAARHGEATEVRVDIARHGDALHLDVVDNGRGFPFTGRYEYGALTDERIGPVTLKSRVRSLRGAMAIESSPAGARVEVRLPFPIPMARETSS